MQRLLVTLLSCLLLIVSSAVVAQDTPADPRQGIPFGVMKNELMEVIYAGKERFRYDVSYSGGLKLGELHLRVDQAEDPKDGFIIHARITTDNGMFSKIYPIEDIYATKVRGAQRLPFHYEVWQEEGYNYKAHRVFKFRQKKGVILYQHNDKPVEVFKVKMPIQNEFSAFFASRLMDFIPGQPFLVPTFADEKRNEVVVMVRGREVVKKTIIGDVDTMVVEPIMEFSGLYDKRGDTVIWYSNDECRVPVKVNSKLVLGSLTAKLVSYSNPACPKYDGAILEKYRKEAEEYTDER